MRAPRLRVEVTLEDGDWGNVMFRRQFDLASFSMNTIEKVATILGSAVGNVVAEMEKDAILKEKFEASCPKLSETENVI